MNAGFWRGKRVLLTGHTGFKGAWLALWLEHLGARVTGIALPPDQQPNLFTAARVEDLCDSRFVDIRDPEAVAAVVAESSPEIVLHLAAQALVRAGYREPITTFDTNVMGTAHVLDALRSSSDLKAVVVVTTDKVYRNTERTEPYREDDVLGGRDPYSASKAGTELVAHAYRESYLRERGVRLATARAGNVIGGGDWSADRLIPDAVRAWSNGDPLEVRNPTAIRPWQHVLEPLTAYLVLAERLWSADTCEAFNFGPDASGTATVAEVLELARNAYGRGEWEAGASRGPHEAGRLELDPTLARRQLGVSARWSLAESIARTMDWYRRHERGENARALCIADIEAYGCA